MWPRIVNAAIGGWLMAAPAVLGYSTTTPSASTNDRVVGPLVMSAAIIAIWDELRPMRWLNAMLGGWLVLAPAILAPVFGWPIQAVLNSVLSGGSILGLALVRGAITRRFGGGWRSIWRDDIDTITGSQKQ